MSLPEVESTLKYLRMAEDRFLYGLERTPDDRLNWNPGGATLTPLQLAGKLAGIVAFFAHFVITDEMPERPRGAADTTPTREAVVAQLNASFARLREVVEGLTEDDLAREIQVPWGRATVREAVSWVPNIFGYMQGQLNYCQLAYGDTDPNIPPSWRKDTA
jgi:hypothetical protein